MYFLVLPALFLSTFLLTVRSESQFSRPPNGSPGESFRSNPVYYVGDFLDVRWVSDLQRMDLWLWRWYPVTSDNWMPNQSLMVNERSTSYLWTVNLDGFPDDIAEGESAILYMLLYDANNSTAEAATHDFNVTRRASRTTSTSTWAATATTSADPGSSPRTDSGLSTGGLVGIAVGSTLCGIAVLGVLGLLAWRRWIQKKDYSGGVYTRSPQVALGELKPELPSPDWVHPLQENVTVRGPTGLFEAP
ncbi:hypothetical protein EDB81DRAFT_474497 [Dactylonectria macrodidyma]|uniref:Mid2 domain-containing protein n=1 Tax=Dactylonectria macrodidyma TaxID=307937 RepID=A0A9P9EZ47_9HYPO|nr:hypothetical protein EDB81DRAFT_474497 [Dactylonectria macrodidyma]